MKKTGGLGRGMNALMGDGFSALETETDISREYVRQIPIGKIDVNKSQPRKDFNSEKIASLAESIKANGMLQPITVRAVGDRYEIIAGERRYRACRLLKAETVPAIVKELAPQQICELALVENLQREDLNPIEEACAIDSLMTEFKLTQQQVSERIGASRPAIANALRLLKLPKKVKDMLISGAVSAGHGRALAALDDSDVMCGLAEKCATEEWSVRRLEQVIKALDKTAPAKPKKTFPEFERIEENMRIHMGTKVKINGTDKKGKIEIEYFNRDDLERLISILAPGEM